MRENYSRIVEDVENEARVKEQKRLAGHLVLARQLKDQAAEFKTRKDCMNADEIRINKELLKKVCVVKEDGFLEVEKLNKSLVRKSLMRDLDF